VKIVSQKAAVVALQCASIWTPFGIGMDELGYGDLPENAVQSVGKTGYTMVYDRGGLMNFTRIGNRGL
jgi:hypothetical protein